MIANLKPRPWDWTEIQNVRSSRLNPPDWGKAERKLCCVRRRSLGMDCLVQKFRRRKLGGMGKREAIKMNSFIGINHRKNSSFGLAFSTIVMIIYLRGRPRAGLLAAPDTGAVFLTIVHSGPAQLNADWAQPIGVGPPNNNNNTFNVSNVGYPERLAR